jgi:hypothetical protein
MKPGSEWEGFGADESDLDLSEMPQDPICGVDH